MYAIYGNIYLQYTPNVSIYTIHGSYGYNIMDIYAHRCTGKDGEEVIAEETTELHSEHWKLCVDVRMSLDQSKGLLLPRFASSSFCLCSCEYAKR